MQKLKLLMIDDSYRLYRNSLAKALAQEGIDLNLIVPYNKEDESVIENISWLSPLAKSKPYTKVKPLRMVHHSLTVANNILIRNRFVHYLKPSIIHLQGVSYPLFEFFLGAKHNVTKVVTIHNIIPNDEFLYNYHGILKKVYQRGGFDAFIIHSQRCKEMLCSHFPSIIGRTFVIPHGCNVIKTTPKHEARKKLNLPVDIYPLILFFGKIRKYKGLKYLLLSLPSVAKYFPEMRLVIAGKVIHDKFREYMDIIDKENLGPKVILRIGHVPEEESDLYFQAADLLVLPYTRFTSQSGVLMRAYSNQCPVLVTDTGAMGETVKKDSTGIVVNQSSVEDLKDGITKILSDKEMQETAKRNMRFLVQTRYGWSHIAKETISLYNSLLRRGV